MQVDEAKPGAGLGIGLADIDVFDYKRHILGVSGTRFWCTHLACRCCGMRCCVGIGDLCAAGSMGFCPRTILAVFCTAGSWCYSKTGQASAGDGFHDYGEKYTTGTSVPTKPASGR